MASILLVVFRYILVKWILSKYCKNIVQIIEIYIIKTILFLKENNNFCAINKRPTWFYARVKKLSVANIVVL